MSKLSKRAISTLVIAIFLLSMITVLPIAGAADLTDVSVIADPYASGESSDYQVFFTTVGAIAADTGTIIITFPAGYDLSLLKPTDISVGVGPAYTPYTPSLIAIVSGTVTITAGAIPIPVLSPVLVNIYEMKVKNPTSPDVYTISVTTSAEDMGSDTVTIVQATGTLDIDTFPVKGSVYIDGDYEGIAPLTNVVVDVGIHTVSFGAISGYTTPSPVSVPVDYTESVEITGNYVAIIPTAGFSIDYVDLVHVGYVDYADVLTVGGSGVTAGTTVNVFWDYASGTYAHLLNNTEGNPDGTFDCEVKVPSDTVGAHYLWATDVATGETISYGPLTMMPKIRLSPSSGLVKDEITVKGYGFSAESDVTIKFEAEVLTDTIETDELGYFTYKFDVPTGTVYGDYTVNALDDKGKSGSAVFIVGASITLTPDEGPTGTVVTVEGRGWTDDSVISFTMAGSPVRVVDDDVITVASDGTFEAEIVILGVASEDEYTIEASELPKVYGPATADFDVTGIAGIFVSPTYGTPGATITVTGSNFTQIAGTEVTLELWAASKAADLVIAETKSDGTFEDTFISPAVTFKTYDVIAEDEYFIDADDPFKVGLIALIINPVYGEAGTRVSITGIGFATGVYNVTFGTKLYEEYGTVSIGDAISDSFWVPNVETGTYDVTITDTDENELTVQFTLTAISKVVLDPSVAPNEYNVSVKGYNFADVKYGDVDFVIYNATDEWEMDVWQNGAGTHSAETGIDGNFTGWWLVPPEDELSLGDYTVNVTDSKDLFVQVPFSVVEARVSVAPRKAQFDRGDLIQFDIKNDFKLAGAYIKIYDPYDTLYWSTDKFVDEWWSLVEGLYTVPYYRQTAAENPMELQSDAPMGAWLYIFYDEDNEQLMNGTFSVGTSTEAQVDQKLTEIWDSMEDLADSIASSDDNTENLIDALSDEFSDKVADIEGMIDDITADLAEELAGVAEGTEAAVGELEGAIGDIAAAQNELDNKLEDMGQDTAAAKKATEDAQKDMQGLTTIVYGAIACSLIAALAAVVSLMQISKKIA